MEQANLDITYAIRQQATLGLAVSYAIGAVEASVSSLGIAYSITDQTTASTSKEYAGTWADNTQAAANMLPDWHAGRKGGAGGNYQKMLNSSMQFVDDIQSKMIRGRRNLHLYSADTNQISHAYTSSVTQRPNEGSSKNLLLNSDFDQKRPAIIGGPMYWSTSGSTGSITHSEDSLFGGDAIELKPEAGQLCRMHQSVNLKSSAAKSYTLTVWVKTPLDSTVAAAESLNAEVASLQLSVIRMDGTPLSTQVALPVSTSGSWQRVSATVSSSSEIYSASCKVEVNATNASRTHLTYVGGMQLEVGEVATSWQQGDSDSSDAPFGVAAFAGESTTQDTIGGQAVTWKTNSGTRVSFIEDENEFLSNFVPTAITAITSVASAPISTAEVSKGRYHEWTDSQVYSTSYQVSTTDSSSIDRVLRRTGEIYQSFKLSERGVYSDDLFINASEHLNSSGSYSQEVKAVCLLEGNLLALVKDTFTPTAGTQKTSWSIKTVSLNQFPGVDELQVVSDLEIPESAALSTVEVGSGAFDYIGVADGDPNNIVISTSGGTPAYFNITVAYDYYTADLNRGQIVTRENYAGNIVIT